MSIIYEVILKKDERLIPDLAVFISNSAKILGLAKKKANFLCFTIETILEFRMNALDDVNNQIKITAEDDGISFKFSVVDLGKPYILTKNQLAILNNKLVDRYSFEQRGRKGQCFSFSYKYDASAIQHDVLKNDDNRKELLDENFTFRRVEPKEDEALKAITCLYDTYGYDYYHQNIYSVKNFIKYMSSGRYVPIIGENKHGQSVCYCALDENEWFLGIPEFSNLVTKPIARGRGLASIIFNKTEEIARSMNYEGIHVGAVAYHPYTQKMCNKLGYSASAIEFSINPKGTGGSTEDRRLDCVVGIKVFDKTKKHNLYLLEECNDIFKMVFDNEKLNYEIFNGKIDDHDEDIIAYYVDSDTNNCFMKIDDCSDNIGNELRNILNKEEVKKCDVITVNLNVNDPSCQKGYVELRKLGFICTGCIPGCLNGDFMLLHAFKVEPEYEKIVLEDNYKMLLQEVNKLNKLGLKSLI